MNPAFRWQCPVVPEIKSRSSFPERLCAIRSGVCENADSFLTALSQARLPGYFFFAHHPPAALRFSESLLGMIQGFTIKPSISSSSSYVLLNCSQQFLTFDNHRS